MKLLGCSIDSGAVREIKLSSCPSVIDNGQVACLANENSDIIYQDSIVYMAEEADVVEGDEVYEDGEFIGIAYFSRGWRVHKSNHQSKELVISQHICMKKSGRDYKTFKAVTAIEDRVGVLVYAGGKEASLFDMVMIKEDEIIFLGRGRRIHQDEVFLSTGLYNDQNVAYYFGQYMKGGYISINKCLEFVIKSSSKEIILNKEEL